MKQKVMHKWFVLLFVFLFPIVITMCGGGDDSGSSTYTLSGRVTTEDGAGLQGVSVTAEGFGWGGCTPPSRTTTTDANGYYAFTETNPPAGQVTITPFKQGYTFSPSSVTVTFNYANIPGQDFTATPVPHVISGRVITAGGAALPGVTVTLSGAASASTITDASGRYAFAGLQNGTYTITPSMTGSTFTPADRTAIVNYADISGLDFTASIYLISGRITTSPGLTFPGVTLALTGTASASATTDVNGYYRFIVQPGSYTITPSMTAPGYTFTPASRTITIGTADALGQDFVMASWLIFGRVTTTGGSGLPGVAVALTGTSSATTTANADGYYVFVVYQNGSYTITPSLTGFAFTPASRDITVNNADVSAQDFVTTAYTISGKAALVGGLGVPGVTMTLTGTASASTTTDSNGYFAFMLAQDGPYTITPSTVCPTFTFTPASKTVTVVAADITGQDFAAAYVSQTTYDLTGGITAAGGAALSGATVTLTGTVSTTTTTDANGQYAFPGLRNGSYTVKPASTDYAFTPVKRTPNLCNSDVAGQDFTATTTWAKSYSSSGYERAYAVQQTSDNGYIVAGYTTTPGLSTGDVWILKLHPNGNIVWQKTYGGSASDSIHAVQPTSDGYIAAGSTSSFGAGGSDAWVIKLDANGNTAWQKTYGGSGDDEFSAIQQTADGGYITAGSTRSFGAGGSDAWVMKLDANGNVVWQKTYGVAAGWDWAASIRQTSDSGYIVAGSIYAHSSGTVGYYDLWVLKLDTDGNVIWQKTYGGTGDDGAQSVQQTADGGYIVAGATALAGGIGATGDKFWVLKLDADGNAAWQKTYGGTGGDEVNSIQQTADGGYIAAGSTYSFGAGYYNVWVLRLSGDGNIVWQKAYGNSAVGDVAYSVQQTTDGGYIVAGGSNEDFLVFKIDSNGNMNGCGFASDTTATASSTSFSPVDSSALVSDTTASVTAPTAVPQNTAASASQECP